jgi:nucleoside-diphosphate-sugar epimerase
MTDAVVVLGGSGFIGKRIVASFAERGTRVKSASRSPDPSAKLGPLVEACRCDVLDADSVRATVAGASVVIAAFVGNSRTQVEGARNVCAALAPSARLLYLSTAEVYGAAEGTVDETAPLASQGWDYSDSKIEAEACCREAARAGLRVSIFRPSIVYGPGSETWTVELGNKLVARQWATLGRLGEGTANLIYVDDLVDALHLTLASDIPPGETFNVNGPDQLSWNEFFEAFNAELGLPPLRRWSRAEALLRAGVGQLLRAAKELAGGRSAQVSSGARTPLAPRRPGTRAGALSRLVEALKATPRWRSLTGLYPRRVVYPDDKARRLLGYAPKVEAREGIRRSAAWFRQALEGAS